MELPPDDEGPSILMKPGSMAMTHDGRPLATPVRKTTLRFPDLEWLPLALPEIFGAFYCEFV